jgi:putative addiction module CopG family antidote
MTIHLPENRHEFVRSLVEGGEFDSEEAVIDAALRLLQEWYSDQSKLADLRHAISLGIEEADRGELGPFDPQATLADIRARRDSAAGPS